MADLSKIKAPDGTEVDIKDATARSGLADKMDKADPTGTGSLSMNRRSGTTVGSYSTALGYNGTASGNYSTSLGNRTKATGAESVAEGYSSTASGSDSHAEGYSTTASGASAHSEGSGTTASGNQSHAEGSGCTAAGTYSHAEGSGSSTASGTAGSAAHAEGYYTQANGLYSHAEGSKTIAGGAQSHAEGLGTKATGLSQHVFGKYNIEDTNNTYVEIVGNGAATGQTTYNASNARTLDWSGNEWLAGGFKCNGMEASSSAVKLINPEKWRDAIFDCTPDGSVKDRLLSRLTKGSANIKVYEYGGYFGGSQKKRLKLNFPSSSYGKYQVFIHMESNLTQVDYQMFLAQNSAGTAFERAAYGKTTPSWTNMAGTAAIGSLTWTANGLQIFSSVFDPYGGWYVKIIAHDGSTTEIPNVYYTNES